MLKKVLYEINNSRIYSKALIGKELDMTEEMVEALVDQLIRMGYIDEDLGSPTCESKCSGCSISSCKTIPIKMLSITEKGRKLLNN